MPAHKIFPDIPISPITNTGYVASLSNGTTAPVITVLEIRVFSFSNIMKTQLYTVRVVVPHNGTFLVGNFAGAHAAREWMDKIKRRLVCELTLERGAHSQSGPNDFEHFHQICPPNPMDRIIIFRQTGSLRMYLCADGSLSSERGHAQECWRMQFDAIVKENPILTGYNCVPGMELIATSEEVDRMDTTPGVQINEDPHIA